MSNTSTSEKPSETAHTPGPWSFQHERLPSCQDKTNAQIEAPHSGNYSIAMVYSGQKEQQANACLIAAAPELLEACKKANEEMRFFGDQAPIDKVLNAKEILRIAIARAEGRAQ